MKPSILRSLASASLAVALMATAATRPHYGGTLRIATRDAGSSLDPANASPGLASKLGPLLFDTLVKLDDNATPQPALARIWQASSDQRRWQLSLRADVKLSDGSVLTPAQVAASLNAANPGWRISVLPEAIVLEFDAPRPHLLAELARPRNAIVVRKGALSRSGSERDGADSGEQLLGTGPYRLAEWQPGHRAVLSANDEYWGGRPFLDTVEVTMGRGFREQIMDLDLGKADAIEITPDQGRRAQQDGRRIELSAPLELIALQFVPGRPATEDAHLRQAVALAIDRVAINNVLLQRQGEPAGGLLPQWLSGYAFLFPVTADLAQARELRPSGYAQLTLAYDAADPLARVIAERIALNARDAGLLIQLAGNGGNSSADARIARFRLDSGDPAAALGGLASALEPAELVRISDAASPEALYLAERALVDEFRVVPLVHLPEVYALAPRVRNWQEPQSGGWPLGSVWLDTGGPAKERP